MIKIAIGTMYFSKKNTPFNTVLLTTILPSLVRPLTNLSLPNIHATKIDINIPPNGKHIEADIKSKISKKVFPNNLKSFNLPIDNEDKIPKTTHRGR